MPKNKKQKTNYHHKTVAELSQAEIWDDSALIRSWEEAKREYEYYHSLAAQGIDPEDILDAAEEAEENDSPIPLGLTEEATTNTHSLDNSAEEGEIEDDLTLEGGIEDHPSEVTPNPPHPTSHPPPPQTPFIGPTAPPPTTPQADPQQAHPPTQPTNSSTADSPSAIAMPNSHPSDTTPTPQQTLENVKMAYYWAGYYSGLYDGQSQAGQ